MQIVVRHNLTISQPTPFSGHQSAQFYQVAAFDANCEVAAKPAGSDRYITLGTVEAGKWAVFEIMTPDIKITPAGETEVAIAGAA